MGARIGLRWLTACLVVCALACEREEPPALREFDAARAFSDLADQVAIGPRPMGSPAAEQTRELIKMRLLEKIRRIVKNIEVPCNIHLTNM